MNLSPVPSPKRGGERKGENAANYVPPLLVRRGGQGVRFKYDKIITKVTNYYNYEFFKNFSKKVLQFQ